jgi:hypothetical protein
VELQPKVQISGEERWRNIDATWFAEYFPNEWIRLTGELITGLTDHTESESSFELTPRIGVRLHLVEQILKETFHHEKNRIEWLPLKRFYLATWLRLEYRNFFYSGEIDSSHEWRFRVRPEFKVAINNESLSDDGTFFGRGDVEFFVPLGDDIPERFSNKIRFRIGPGYRFNEKYKLELLFMHDRNRHSLLVDFEEEAYMLDLRLTFLF